MKDSSIYKLGAICSILLAGAYFASGVTYVMLPPEFRVGADLGTFLGAFAQNPTLQTAHYWAFALAGVFGIGAVIAISALVRPVHEGWARWTAGIAYLGFAVFALDHFKRIGLMPERAAAYVAASDAVKAAMAANHHLIYLDHGGWLRFGAVGLWIVIVNVLALRGGVLPRVLAYLGIISGLVFGTILAGIVLLNDALITLGGTAATFLLPGWLIWMGLVLSRRAASQTPAPAQQHAGGLQTGQSP